MPSAIDVFREQREAADQVHARLAEISTLLGQVRQQVNALALNQELRAVLKQEESWLVRTRPAVAEVRSFREQDMLRFWPGVVRRWIVALVLALGSAAAAGAGYAWVTQSHSAERAALRSQVEFAEFVQHRIAAMTPTERRQFDTLMRLNLVPKR
jgi:hypothetical protein